MEWIINELSLENKFNSVDDFICGINEFLKHKQSHARLIDGLLCHREIGNIEVVKNMTFAHIICDMPLGI